MAVWILCCALSLWLGWMCLRRLEDDHPVWGSVWSYAASQRMGVWVSLASLLTLCSLAWLLPAIAIMVLPELLAGNPQVLLTLLYPSLLTLPTPLLLLSLPVTVAAGFRRVSPPRSSALLPEGVVGMFQLVGAELTPSGIVVVVLQGAQGEYHLALSGVKALAGSSRESCLRVLSGLRDQQLEQRAFGEVVSGDLYSFMALSERPISPGGLFSGSVYMCLPHGDYRDRTRSLGAPVRQFMDLAEMLLEWGVVRNV